MRILVLHQNMFERMAYDAAFDHDRHEVVYAGTRAYVENVPAHIRHGTFTWDPAQPVEEQLEPWMRRQPRFDRILARHEALILPAAMLRERFGIPGMHVPEALNFRDKVAMKRAVAAAGLRVPRFVPVSLLLQDGQQLPWSGRTVVKPRDGAGSADVTIFDTVGAARAFVEASCRADARFAHRFEVEEFLAGPMWEIDGYMYRGEPVAIQASRYIDTCLAFEQGSPMGSVQRPRPDLEAWAGDCLRALSRGSLTFHLEAIETETGPAFLEVAARCGGGNVVDVFRLRHGVYLHTLDMASEVEGTLATRHAGGEPSEDFYGWFLFPGHTRGGAACRVTVPDNLLRDPRILSYRICAPDRPLPTSRSYRPENLPFSGMLAGPDPNALEELIAEVLARTSITAIEPSEVSAATAG
jgi:hypothetical protein